jgi:hypothetical protein
MSLRANNLTQRRKARKGKARAKVLSDSISLRLLCELCATSVKSSSRVFNLISLTAGLPTPAG